jgi:hypothetical protein
MIIKKRISESENQLADYQLLRSSTTMINDKITAMTHNTVSCFVAGILFC